HSRRKLRRLEPKRDRRPRHDVGRRLAGRLRDRGPRRRRPRLSRTVRAGERAGAAKTAPPCLRRDRRLGGRLAPRQRGHRRCAGAVQGRRHRRSHAAIPRAARRRRSRDRARAPLSMRINGWEWRWPLNTYRERDASKLSRAMLTRLAEAEAMSLDDYRNDLAQRDKARALYAELAAECDACVSLSALAAAPLALEST